MSYAQSKYKHPLRTVGTVFFFLGILSPMPFWTGFIVAIACWSFAGHLEADMRAEMRFQEKYGEEFYETENKKPYLTESKTTSEIEPQYQYCVSCGNKYKLNFAFCNECGKKSEHRMKVAV